MVKNIIKNTVIIGSLVIGSCSDRTNQNDTLNIEEQTPEVLENNKEIELSSITKRYHEDIIDRLFDEAMEKDENLKELIREIDQINEFKNDSLKKYNNYIQNNNEYWSSLDRHIRQINDSTLKNEMIKTFNILEKNYNKKIISHNQAIGELSVKTNYLIDYEVVLKLIISGRMIDNYQRNELPDINSIYGVTYHYDTLINDIKKYIELRK